MSPLNPPRRPAAATAGRAHGGISVRCRWCSTRQGMRLLLSCFGCILVPKTLVNPSTRRSVGRLSLPRKTCSSGCVLLSSSASAWVALAFSCWTFLAAACCPNTWLSTYCCMACFGFSAVSEKRGRQISCFEEAQRGQDGPQSFSRYYRRTKTSHTAVCRQPSDRAASSCPAHPTRRSQRNPSASRRGEENATRGTRFPRQRQPTHRSPCRGVDESLRYHDANQAEKQQHSAAATASQAFFLFFSQTCIRTPAVFYGNSKVGEDPLQKVSVLTSQMNAFFGRQRCLGSRVAHTDQDGAIGGRLGGFGRRVRGS